jgi:hypothetical protein
VIENGIISHVSLTMEDHGILTAWLTIDKGGCSQGFGGYDLRGEFCAHFILGVLRAVLGEEELSWENLVGKPCRVDFSPSSPGRPSGMLIGIGHFARELWYYPEKELRIDETH